MSSKRYDVCQAQERGDKTYWHKFATMWESDDGKKSLTFDSLPIPSLNRDGKLEVRAMCFEPKPRDGQGEGGGGRSAPAASEPDSDDIPF